MGQVGEEQGREGGRHKERTSGKERSLLHQQEHHQNARHRPKPTDAHGPLTLRFPSGMVPLEALNLYLLLLLDDAHGQIQYVKRRDV